MKQFQNNKHKILILDADHKNTLAIVRHLGALNKFSIDLVSSNKRSIAFYSKYANKKHVISNPHNLPEQFISDLINILKAENYLVIIPVSFLSFQLCSKHKENITKYTHLTIADYSKIQLASSKIDTYNLAEQIGIPYPFTYKIESIEQVNDSTIEFPCVIKAPIEMGKNIVSYLYNIEDFKKKYVEICNANYFNNTPPIVQKYIKGDGYGFFAFYKNGVLKNYFIHKRLREYPATGGSSTTAESFFDENILIQGKKILDSLNWNGVAMVEFKRDDRDGIYYLMEINAKFWGSLDLALISGINFPLMLIQDALGEEISKSEYSNNVRFQWLLNGDLFHLFQRPWHIFSFVKDLFIAKNDFFITDLKPNLFQFVYIFVFYYKKWFK